MANISIRDLQKLSAETIGALPGPTTVKSGERTVALLVPLKTADPDRLAAVLTRAEALAKGGDPVADDAALAPFGEVDPVDWSVEAVRADGRACPRVRTPSSVSSLTLLRPGRSGSAHTRRARTEAPGPTNRYRCIGRGADNRPGSRAGATSGQQ